MSIFYVLIYVFSLTFQLPVSLDIFNWCQDIDLTSPIQFIRGGRCRVTPDQEMGDYVLMSNLLEFDSGQDILEGALVYKIQRKQSASDKLVQDESKSIQLLVT
jgi:hypothetical protein